MNGKYFIPSWEDEDQGEWVQLKDGEYDRKDHDNVLYVKIVATALGRLSPGRGPDAAVIYGYGTGGTGFFVLLGAVTDNQGHRQTSQVINLEDRVKINSPGHPVRENRGGHAGAPRHRSGPLSYFKKDCHLHPGGR